MVIDALASPALLELATGAAVHDVGKRAGRHSATQEEINRLLVDLASAGHRVVRLKGGDPFVFGRGGEECEALRDAGIAWEVVPGVTSAIAAPAAAGIPVTHRDWAGHVTILTGHERDDGDGTGRVDLAALAALLPGGTLVVLMGARTLARVVAGLLAAGADPATPAAAVQWGTDPRQREVAATLGTLEAAVRDAGLGAPMVTVIGRVAALGATLAWRRPGPLTGRRILVTRARTQASGLLARLRELGAEAVELPVIAVEPMAERTELLAALHRIARPHPGGRYAVLASANAVRLVLDGLDEAGMDARDLAGVTIVAVGPETAAALRQRGLRADLLPERFSADGVGDALLARGVAGAQVWLPRAAAARDRLPARLAEAGALVEVTALYRSVVPEGTRERLHAALDAGGVDAVTFTSSSTVTHFVDALGGRPFPAGAVAACIGPVTAESARAAGLPVAVVADAATTDALADALAAHLTAAPLAGSALPPLP